MVATLIRIAVTWLIVDWISGLIHWFEDSYGRPSTPFVGRRITKPNLRHHFRPRAFVNNSWLVSSELLLISCTAAIAIAWSIGRLSPMVVLGAFLGANANQVHKWSHRTPQENGRLITFAQKVRLLQSPRHHHLHHIAGRDSNYCVLTDLLNPVLDASGFWRGLEWMLAQLGLQKRDDDAMLAEVLRTDPDFLTRAASSSS